MSERTMSERTFTAAEAVAALRRVLFGRRPHSLEHAAELFAAELGEHADEAPDAEGVESDGDE